MLAKIFLYLLSICFGVLFALYLSAPVGWIFVYTLVAAPAFSFVVTLWLSRTSSVSLRADVSRSMLYKRETVTLKIYAENKSVFPVPAVKIRLRIPEGLSVESGAPAYVITVSPRSQTVTEITCRARIWGVCKIGAESAYLHDFMGFFRFALPCADVFCEVKIFPDIPEIPGDAPLLRSAAESAKFSDDSEETRESDGAPHFGGMPGYTHKEYAEGDPVRRINWKLSSKRDKYMVRLDDEIESVQQTIILDACGGYNIRENERAVEGMLAAALGLLKCGSDSTIFCRFGGAFEKFEISDPADVSALRIRLADFRFADEGFKGDRIPLKNLAESGGKGILLYTPLFDKKLNAEISAASEQGVKTAVISSDSGGSGSAYQVWRLNEDYSAELVTL